MRTRFEEFLAIYPARCLARHYQHVGSASRHLKSQCAPPSKLKLQCENPLLGSLSPAKILQLIAMKKVLRAIIHLTSHSAISLAMRIIKCIAIVSIAFRATLLQPHLQPLKKECETPGSLLAGFRKSALCVDTIFADSGGRTLVVRYNALLAME